MPGDGLNELDVGAGGDQARDARVPEIVEAVALVLEDGTPQRLVPYPLSEVRRLERVPCMDPKTSSSGA